MMTSPMNGLDIYHRRVAVSLLVAVLLHGLLAVIPLYRWLGNNPGDSGGVGGGNKPFVGTLLGASVIVRSPTEAPSDRQLAENQPVATSDAAVDVDPVVSTPGIDALQMDALAVDVMPPSRAGTTGGASGSALAGSLQPLAGGGGVEIEMDLQPKKNAWPDPLTEIVIDREIDAEVRLQILVDRDGMVIDHRVLQSIPDCPECTASAVDAALRTIFAPPVYDGEIVRAWVSAKYRFGTARP